MPVGESGDTQTQLQRGGSGFAEAVKRHNRTTRAARFDWPAAVDAG